MRVGIIGLPMTGKSSLFRLLTGAEDTVGGSGARAEQRQTRVVDPRLDRLAEDFDPKKITEATIDFLDFPPVTKPGGGERRSCADLLSPAREAGALITVVRSFESSAVPPNLGRVDPAAELAELVEELRYADLDVAGGRVARLEASIPKKRGDDKKALEAECETLARCVAQLEDGGEIADMSLSPDEERIIRGFQFLSAKPRLVVENVGEPGGGTLEDSIPVAVAIEVELEDLDEESRAVFAEEYGLVESARGRVLREIYRRAGLISFLTAGEKEVRAWTIPERTPAVEAAGAIHTDISRGFIRAEVVAYDDYIADGGMAGAKEKGHLRLEGKDYRVQDGDIIEFRFNV